MSQGGDCTDPGQDNGAPRGHVTCQEISLLPQEVGNNYSVSKGEVLWLILGLPSVRGREDLGKERGRSSFTFWGGGMGKSSREGCRRGPDLTQPDFLCASQKRVWRAGTWMATGHLEAYTLLPRDTPCSGGSQLSFRTPEITGASWLSGFVISLMGTLKLKTKCSLWPGYHKVAPECQGLHPSCQNRFLWSGIPDMDKRLRVKRGHLTEPNPTGQSQGGHGRW